MPQIYTCTDSQKHAHTSAETPAHTDTSGRSRISRRGGVDLIGGGVDSRGGYVLKILYVKMKELGPLGGGMHRARPPRSANGYRHIHTDVHKHTCRQSQIHF